MDSVVMCNFRDLGYWALTIVGKRVIGTFLKKAALIGLIQIASCAFVTNSFFFTSSFFFVALWHPCKLFLDHSLC